jgi:hypothetical protein
MREKFMAARQASDEERPALIDKTRAELRERIGQILTAEQKKRYQEILAEIAARQGAARGRASPPLVGPQVVDLRARPMERSRQAAQAEIGAGPAARQDPQWQRGPGGGRVQRLGRGGAAATATARPVPRRPARPRQPPRRRPRNRARRLRQGAAPQADRAGRCASFATASSATSR